MRLPWLSQPKRFPTPAVEDKIVSGFNEKGLSKKYTVKVRSHPGNTTKDLIDNNKPVMRQNPDLVIIQFGTNDITNNGVNKKENLQDTIECMYKYGPQTNSAISLHHKKGQAWMTEKNLCQKIIIDVCIGTTQNGLTTGSSLTTLVYLHLSRKSWPATSSVSLNAYKFTSRTGIYSIFTRKQSTVSSG